MDVKLPLSDFQLQGIVFSTQGAGKSFWNSISGLAMLPIFKKYCMNTLRNLQPDPVRSQFSVSRHGPGFDASRF